ncbi:abscisic acid receptor PYR1 [Striga asiatica]|uniref:Abscisic acid receptor PYR1 n=1 Tax=Striga asiatica TaxID=4170 RepID=A0A5A7QDL6_STRAF|nr:abscisic acid receptor PYR1 [Striga asiatica]
MTSSFIYKERMIALYHTNPMVPNRCSLMLTRSIDARLPVVWSLMRDFPKPTSVSCGDATYRMAQVGPSTELLERLDDDQPVIVVPRSSKSTTMISKAREPPLTLHATVSLKRIPPTGPSLAGSPAADPRTRSPRYRLSRTARFSVVSVGDLVGNSGGARGFVCFGGPLGFFLDEEDGGVNAVGWDFLLPRRRGLRESRRMRIWGFVICGGIRVSGRRI